MADIPRFTVVKIVGATNRLASVQAFDPSEDVAPSLAFAHTVLGVTMTASDSPEDVAIIQNGYMRELGSADITGFEPSTGSLLWCGPSGKVTTTRPTTGALVLVGSYMGGGDVDVRVSVLPAITELSFVQRKTPSASEVFVWDAVEELFVIRQLDHGDDLLGLEDDDHPQYSLKADLTNHFLFMGAS